jgi:hypothetical protein
MRSPRFLLGSEHPLVRALDAVQIVARQSRVVGAIVASSSVALVAGARLGGPIAIGGAAVLVGLAAVAAALRRRVRDEATKLILAGRDGLPVAAVQAQRRRLLAPRTRRALSRSLESMARRASNPSSVAPIGARPLFDVTVIATVSKELRAVASLLRARRVPANGVALAERLLTDGMSPLYGREVAPLRDDLGRLKSILSAG